jgi:soluble lytic murein transglycosylase-like protein
LFAAAAALALCAALAGGANANGMRPLTTEDAQLYNAAFEAVRKGDFQTADASAERVSDKSLLGYLELQKLMAPSTKTPFDALVGWLSKYADLPGADRVFTLAKKRAPAGVEVQPPLGTEQRAYVSARDAFYSGDTKAGHTLAEADSEHWIAGLADFRLKNFSEARGHFQQVAFDGEEDDWVRAGAAYWAARSAIAEGKPEDAPEYLRLAARASQTFYGMIAERQLGVEPGALAGPLPYAPQRVAQDRGLLVKASYGGVNDQAAQVLLQYEARARRAAALIQIGRTEEGAAELRRGILGARSEEERRQWTSLARQLNAQAAAARPTARRAKSYDPYDYPAPDLQPLGGFTVDKAMVYALVRQESRFNPQATSWAGARGLMQLLPGTAADATGNDGFKRTPSALYDPSVNLRAGQDYLDYLMRNYTGGDMVRTIAAYNGGPGAVIKAERNGGAYDTLMVIESLPAPETRAYVEEVMASYWTYRRIFGERTRSMDALAAGAKLVDARLDRSPNAPALAPQPARGTLYALSPSGAVVAPPALAPTIPATPATEFVLTSGR